MKFLVNICMMCNIFAIIPENLKSGKEFLTCNNSNFTSKTSFSLFSQPNYEMLIHNFMILLKLFFIILAFKFFPRSI